MTSTARLFTQFMHINEFIEHLENALSDVPSHYYGLSSARGDLQRHYGLHEGTEGYRELWDLLERHDERVFCYELYHRLRLRIPDRDTGDGLPPICLQGELKKDFIGPALSNLTRLERLSKEFFPDFLLHQPGTAKHQYVVMEVKADPQVSWSKLRADLAKLDELIQLYHYAAGVSLVVNCSPERVWHTLHDEPNRTWLSEHLSRADRIVVICKQRQADAADTRTLAALLADA